jgi:hypothetical protein
MIALLAAMGRSFFCILLGGRAAHKLCIALYCLGLQQDFARGTMSVYREASTLNEARDALRKPDFRLPHEGRVDRNRPHPAPAKEHAETAGRAPSLCD